MTRFMTPLALLAMLSFSAATSTDAASLFRDQMNDGAGWSANVGGTGDSQFTFDYDYSANGIPEAPNAEVGDVATRGVKLEANLVAPAAGEFFTLFPNGQNFTGDYQLRFDTLMHYGSGGSTEFIGGGIGYDNVTADIASGAQLIATGEGGSSNDWRAFKSAPQFFIPDADMTAGTHQGADPYYADFLPTVNGSVAGSPGFQWVTFEFNVAGNDVNILIEKPDGSRLEIVSYDKTSTADGSAGVATDGNISLFYADFFSSVADDPALQFGLIDNVVVTALVPEPTSLVLVGFAATMLGFRRRNG